MPQKRNGNRFPISQFDKYTYSEPFLKILYLSYHGLMHWNHLKTIFKITCFEYCFIFPTENLKGGISTTVVPSWLFIAL